MDEKINEILKGDTNMYGWTCPDCGANLDPGEKCDCKNENTDKEESE